MVELNQYYTSDATSKLLASQLEVNKVKNCLELSAGEGALIKPLKQINPSIQLTTVDLDPNNTAKLSSKYPTDRHICEDALSSNLNLIPNSFDLAVCNPPFSYCLVDQNSLEYIPSNYCELLKKTKKIRNEVLFIIRNLYFLKDGAILAIIVPDLIFTSSKFSEFRKLLFTENTLLKVIECERSSFKKTEAKTYILFLKKQKPINNNYVSYIKSMGNKLEEKKLLISSTYIKENLDERSDLIIFRGSNSSKECRLSNRPFHHNYKNLTDLSKINYPDVKSNQLNGFKYAKPDDILIHRVGRNVGITVILDKNDVIISDCIIVVRFYNKNLRKKFLDKWRLIKQDWISSYSKGTCARNISIRDIKEFINTL
ncbi:TPA: N-6 DNA methylase [Photobacterium damselae]